MQGELVWQPAACGHGVDLGLLTRNTLLTPLRDISLQVRPDVTGGDEAAGGAGTRMGEAVEVLEDLAAKGSWYVGAKNAC